MNQTIIEHAALCITAETKRENVIHSVHSELWRLEWLSTVRDYHGEWLRWVAVVLSVIKLSTNSHQFNYSNNFKQSNGRVALIASILCTVLGMHLILCLQLALIRFGVLSNILSDYSFWTEDTLQMALQWTVYVIFLCTFHLGEFFTTAVFNPTVTTADSFMVNHSKAYTTAALVRILWYAAITTFFWGLS